MRTAATLLQVCEQWLTTPVLFGYPQGMDNTEKTRKNRQTGTMVTVTEWGGQYFTICEDHEIAVGHENKTQARSWAAEPLVWCAGCQDKRNKAAA